MVIGSMLLFWSIYFEPKSCCSFFLQFGFVLYQSSDAYSPTTATEDPTEDGCTWSILKLESPPDCRSCHFQSLKNMHGNKEHSIIRFEAQLAFFPFCTDGLQTNLCILPPTVLNCLLHI